MKKRTVLVLALLLCILLIPMAGSLAFFTQSETAHNVITSGNVDIEIHEFTYNEQSELIPFGQKPVKVMPGEKVDKIVQIKNTGSGPAWIRVKLNPEFKLDNEKAPVDFRPDFDLVDPELNIGEDLWAFNPNGREPYLYLLKPLGPGDMSVPVLESVTFDTEMGNEYQNSVFTLDIEAEAVQTQNNGTDVFEAKGWPETETAPLPTSAPLT